LNGSYNAYLPVRTSAALADGARVGFFSMPYLLLFEVDTTAAQSRDSRNSRKQRSGATSVAVQRTNEESQIARDHQRLWCKRPLTMYSHKAPLRCKKESDRPRDISRRMSARLR
jgi:hypothetical protein